MFARVKLSLARLMYTLAIACEVELTNHIYYVGKCSLAG